LLRAIGASAGALFLAVGKPDLRAKLQIAQLVVFALSLYPLCRAFGVLGVAYSVTAYSLLNLPAAHFGLRLVELGPSSLLRPLLVDVIAAVSGACCAWLCAHWLGLYALPALFTLIVAGACGLGVTALMLLWLEPNGELAQSLRALRRLRRA
jgi:O-antigen/teichoic acid export membrane protein